VHFPNNLYLTSAFQKSSVILLFPENEIVADRLTSFHARPACSAGTDPAIVR
jgi:hypothetical protein